MPKDKFSAVALVTAAHLKILSDKDIEKLDFPKEYFDDMRVLEGEKLKSLIVGYLAKIDVKKKNVSILISQEVLFQQSIPLTELEDVKKQSDAFFKEIPLSEDELAKKTLTNDKEVYLIATNKELFSVIKDSFEQTGWTVESILPASLFFGFQKDGDITKKDAENVYKSDALYQAANFLSDAKSPLIETSEEKKSSKKWVIILAIVLAVVLVGFGAKASGKLSFLAKPAPTPTAAPTQAPTPTPSVTPKDKGLIKIQILNGSGVPGQAGQVKSSIVDLGFTSSNITTDNADTSDHQGTTAEFGNSVSKDDRDSVIKALKKTFTSVTDKDSSSQAYDIIITTGK